MHEYHLAHFNIALLRTSYESPIMSDFLFQLDPIYGLAEKSPGFIWQREEEDGDDTGFDATYLLNVSVWEDVESLQNFVYKSKHAGMMRRRQKWFKDMKGPKTVLWWVPVGHRPTFLDAKLKLEQLWGNGHSEAAFTFRNRYSLPVLVVPNAHQTRS